MSNTREHGRSHLDHISDRIGGVLDPVTARLHGWTARRSARSWPKLWRREFSASLGEPGLSDTAAAIHDGRPLSDGLWTDGW